LDAVSGAEPARVAAEALRQIRGALGELDRAVGNAPARYRAAADGLAALPVKVEINRLFQVNLVPAGARVQLGRDVLDEISRVVAVLGRLARARGGGDEMSRFRDAFVERYK